MPDTDAMTKGARIIWELRRGSWQLAAVTAFVQLGCEEHLAGGPLAVTELARRCGAQAPPLARVLRTVAALGLIRTASPGCYALTEAGQVLRTAQRAGLAWEADKEIHGALGDLAQTVRAGRPAFTERHGDLFAYLAANPETGKQFDEFLTARSESAARLADVADLSAATTIVDVGGGQGTFLVALLRANPGLRGVLLELDRAVPGARAYLADAGVADRSEVIGGDFFASVPAGADCYLLASVIHDWQDEPAGRLLGKVREAVPAGGLVLLVDPLLSDDDSPDPGKDIDMHLLSLDAGVERSRGEYLALLARSGFQVGRVRNIWGGISLVEARPA